VFETAKRIITGTPIEPLARQVYSVIATWFYKHLDPSKDAREHRQVRAVIERVLSADSNAVDVGASVGVILETILKAAPNGTHYAFEPIPTLQRELVKSFPTVVVVAVALSDKPIVAPFYHVVNEPAYSGIRQRIEPSNDDIVEQIEVRQDTLDNVIGERFPIDFIKVDVEGAETLVLKGAAATIRNNKPIIVFEHELEAIQQYGIEPDEIYRLLCGYGLCVSLVKDWLQGKKPLSREDFVQNVERGDNINFIAHP
jgi:FkbM family methyltransferase